MLNHDGTPDELPYRITKLLCRRTGHLIAPEEHKTCPYCFGREGEVETGIHQRFCDYQPGRDPKHFGFPEGTERDIEG